MPILDMTHPSGSELHDFFSDEPVKQLSTEECKKIALHVLLCKECAKLGKVIEGNEERWNALVDAPETPDSKAALEESLSWFRNLCKS